MKTYTTEEKDTIVCLDTILNAIVSTDIKDINVEYFESEMQDRINEADSDSEKKILQAFVDFRKNAQAEYDVQFPKRK